MPAENALGFLRIVETAKTLPGAILIAGPHAFLREYLVDTLARRLIREGLQYRTFQIANASDFASVVEELRAPDLFAPKRMLVCRVMRSFRDRGGDDSAASDDGAEKETRGGDTGLIAAVTDARPPNHLVIVYDKDAAPAKIRRAAESAGMLVNCLRPFDNQLPLYAQSFARGFGLKLSQSAGMSCWSRGMAAIFPRSPMRSASWRFIWRRAPRSKPRTSRNKVLRSCQSPSKSRRACPPEKRRLRSRSSRVPLPADATPSSCSRSSLSR